MKIAQINVCMLQGRGSDRVVCELAMHLSRSHSVSVFAPFGANIACDGVEVIGRGNECKRGLARLLAVIRVVRELRRRSSEFDILHCHHALLSFAVPAKRLVTTYHGYRGRFHYGLGPRVAHWLRRFVNVRVVGPALRRSAVVTVVSTTLAEEIRPSLGHSVVSVIHNAVKFRRSDSLAAATSLRTHFLYCGRIDHDKSVDILVAQYSRLNIDTPLLLVGEGPLREKLEREYGGTKIRFLGLKNSEELSELYHSAIAFVTASTYETFCLPVIEAAACGCPSVGPSSGATAEVIQHEVTGFVFSTEREFGERLAYLARMLPEQRDEIGRRCVDWATNFRWERKADQYLAVFRQLLGDDLGQITRADTHTTSLQEK